MSFFTPAERPLVVPGTSRRALRRPDLRSLFNPQVSGAPLSDGEIDYDDLIVHRTYRSYEPDRPGEVRYFMYELSQKDAGQNDYGYFWKAVRMVRLTRVPRYLRQGGASGPNMVFEQQRDLMAALREKGTLFLNIIAKSPQIPLIFAYGVQGIGSTPEEAQLAADEAYAVLTYQLDGTYQQLEYAPITLDQGERLARYQSEWDHIAMGRGRPLPTGSTLGSSGLLDGNRTDVESTNNQLESFIRGMGDKSFMLSLVTVPLSPAEITVAWRNITDKLSNFRSDQDGARGISAGAALPLSMGQSLGDSSGNTHSAGTSHGVSSSDSVSHSLATGASSTTTDGVNQGVSTTATQGVSMTETQGVSVTATEGVSTTATQGVSLTATDGVSLTATDGRSITGTDGLSVTGTDGVSAAGSQGVSQSLSDSISQGMTLGQSLTATDSASQSASISQGQTLGESLGTTRTEGASASVSQGASQGISVGQSFGLTDSRSISEGASVSQGSSLALGQSVGSNWSNSIGQSLGGSLTSTNGLSNTQTDSLSQTLNLGANWGDSINGGWSQQLGNDIKGGLLGFGGGSSASEGFSGGNGQSAGNSLGLSQSGGGSNAVGLSQSLAQSLSQGFNLGESFGGSLGQSATATNNVGQSQSIGVGQSLAASQTTSASESQGLSQSASQGLSVAQALSQGLSQSQSLTQGQGISQGQSLAQGQSLSQTAGLGRTEGIGQSATFSNGVSQSLAQGASTSLAQGASTSLAQGQSQSLAQGQSQSLAQGQSQSLAQGQSSGASHSVAQGQSLSASDGTSSGVSANQALSDAYMVAMSRQASSTNSLGVVPSLGVTISKQTRDEAKRFVGDILEAQMRRYSEGIKAGAFLYQMFFICPDRETLVGGSGLLKSAFWGSGGTDSQLPQPFHTIDSFEEDERRRLLVHASAFTSYRRRESVTDLIEPFAYSSYLTPSEAAAFTHPPTAESLGLQAVHDSMPVLRMPFDRQEREISLGHIVNGERGKVSDWVLGVDIDEIIHALITGASGSGKTTTLMRFLSEAVNCERTIVSRPTRDNPHVSSRVVRPSVLFLDWMRNGRNLASVVDEDRFQFFSVMKPELGAFRWNLLAVPSSNMSPVEWLNAQADNFVASFNLGEFGRSLLAEFLNDLYSANRLEDFVLRKEVIDEGTGAVIRPADILPALDRTTIPATGILVGPDGTEVANVFTHPELSRCVSMAHLATLVAAKVELMADPNAARIFGTAMRDRLQSLWRRMQYFAPGGQFTDMLGCDPDLQTQHCLRVEDLIDADRGVVTVLETDGLDYANRRVILGSLLLAVYRTGLAKGEGAFDNDSQGPGTFVVLEEAHELFGEQGPDEDAFSASTRTALYESMFRRARALGLHLIAVVQNPASIPSAITSNTSTVLVHQTFDTKDRDRVFSMLNWSNMIGQHMREWRWLGEMPTGWCILRLPAKVHYLEAAPVQFLTEPPAMDNISDADLVRMARKRRK